VESRRALLFLFSITTLLRFIIIGRSNKLAIKYKYLT